MSENSKRKKMFYVRCKSNSNREIDLIEEYYRAKKKGHDAMLELLYCCDIDLPSYRGSYWGEGYHFRKGAKCGFEKSDRLSTKGNEKRIMKCMAFRANGYEKCSGCLMEGEATFLEGDYKVLEYEVPFTLYEGLKSSKIDLVLQKDGIKYATEIKPPTGNDESILRMIAEIITYTYGFPDIEYRRAIAFFEDSAQDGYFKEISPELLGMINDEEITVFRFEKSKNRANAYVVKKIIA